MDAVDFYRPVSSKLCQGDVLARVPLLQLRDVPVTISRATLPGKIQGFAQGPTISDAPSPAPGTTLLVPAPCEYTRAILLTHDCQIDKPGAKHLTVALVRSFGGMPDAERDKIRSNEAHAYYHLPEGPGGLVEAYVDFRRLTTLSVSIVNAAERLTSLTDPAWEGMVFQLARFFTGIGLDRSRFVRPS